MKRIKFFVFVSMSMWFAGCQQPNRETDTDEVTTDSLLEISSNATDIHDTVINFQDSPSSLDHVNDDFRKITIREGTHNLSLQWISWEELGEAEIKYLGDNKYSIVGEQRSLENSHYLKIEGTLEPISEKELIFDGIVEQQITHLNQGQPCLKKGKQTFKSTKNRKYWRMQDMQNCEGGGVVDYVDIYF